MKLNLIYLDLSNVCIYFTVDGTKPDPFRKDYTSTNLYRGAFRLGQGKRIIKAIAVTKYQNSFLFIFYNIFFSSDGSCESHVTTKCFDVNDIYSEDYNDGYSDYDQSLIVRFSFLFFK